jgi:penicillin-binding protein 1C
VLVSPDRFARRLVALGLPIRKPGDFYGYSIALGSPEVTLLSLANAYRALANGGLASAPRLQPVDGAPATTRVMDGAASFVVADILSDNGARVPTFGLDNALATRYWSAVKTGTSKDMRDNWCVGFSARYTVGVWVGNASGAPMHAVSGVTGAAPVWRTVMDALQRSDVASEHPGRPGPATPRGVAPGLARDARAPAGGLLRVAYTPSPATAAVPGAPTPPAGLVAQAISFDRQVEAARTEWFLAGTETAHIALASPAGTAARLIASPDDKSVIALDPDMPPAVQRLRFEAVAPVPAGAWWRLDGRRLGAARPLPWAPWPGRHELALVDAKGVALDTVTFDVRGAQARPPAAPVRKAAHPLAAASRPGA